MLYSPAPRVPPCGWPCGSSRRRPPSWKPETLIPVSFAHLDACFYAGQAHVDFAQFLMDHGARFAVPAWTNSGLVSLADPDAAP